MATVRSRQENLAAALDRLEETVALFTGGTPADRFYENFRDSVIKRFEFSFDLFWKVLKDFIADQHGIIVASPRSVFKEAFAQNIVTKEDLNTLGDMIDDRNNTTHCYDGALAEEIARRIESHLAIMMRIFEQFSEKNKTA